MKYKSLEKHWERGPIAMEKVKKYQKDIINNEVVDKNLTELMMINAN